MERASGLGGVGQQGVKHRPVGTGQVQVAQRMFALHAAP